MLSYKHLVPRDEKRPNQDVLRGRLVARTHCIHEALATLIYPSTLTQIAKKSEEIAKRLRIEYTDGVTFTADNTRNHLDQQFDRGYWTRKDGKYALSISAIKIINDAGGNLGPPRPSEVTSPKTLLPSKSQLPSSQDYQIEQELEDSWALVKQRQKQSRFRQLAFENFGGVCCLTGVANRDLLVAAHIVRWADDPEPRLKPENGLLLYHEYDLLFENGYFYFDDNYTVCVPEWVAGRAHFERLTA